MTEFENTEKINFLIKGEIACFRKKSEEEI